MLEPDPSIPLEHIDNQAVKDEPIELTESERLNIIFTENVTQWFSDKGDLTHRINYDELDENSIVLDLGGYEGGWASNIYSKYNCNIKIFEPKKEYYDFIKTRFSKNNKIEVCNFAFSNINKEDILYILNDSSSLYLDFDKADEVELIKIKNFNEYLENLETVDLVKINIEGSEYDLLECISDVNLIKLKNIQVQFHTFITDCEIRRNIIRNKLEKTHDCTYNYDFVWENWRIKNEQ